MPRIWYTFAHWLTARLYYARIALRHGENLPVSGPILFLGLHRNGAMDGLVYRQALGPVVFMISTQLRRNWFARLFFDGIAVARSKDAQANDNPAALQRCVDHLRSGGRLFVFPEGTSSLGPRHLPFKSGAAWLIADCLATCSNLTVIPVGIHYECAWAFRSKVEVVVGEPISTDGLPESSLARIKELRRRIQSALEEVGLNVASAETQRELEQLAYVSTLATPRSWFDSLKALESGVPTPIRERARALEPQLQGRHLLRHQGVPLFPMRSPALYLMVLLLMAPMVLTGIAVNLPPLLAGWIAGKKFPDGLNVVALWRILVGAPLFVAWVVFTLAISCVTKKPLLAVSYLLITLLALLLYYRVKKLAVAVHNGLRFPALRPAMLEFRRTVLESLAARDEAPSTQTHYEPGASSR